MFHTSIKVLTGCKWSTLWCFRECFRLESLDWFGCVAVSCWFTERASIFVSWVTRNVFIWGFTHQDTWGGKKKMRHNVSEFPACRGAEWREKSDWFLGFRARQEAWSTSRVIDFYCFRGVRCFQGSQISLYPCQNTCQQKTQQSHFKTVVTYPVWSSNLFFVRKITETRQKHYPSPELKHNIVQDK